MSSPVPLCNKSLDWQPCLFPGASIAALNIDEKKCEIPCLLRAEPGARHPLHCHRGIEEIFVVEGSLEIDGQYYGKYTTFALSALQGCLCFLKTSSDNEEGVEES